MFGVYLYSISGRLVDCHIVTSEDRAVNYANEILYQYHPGFYRLDRWHWGRIKPDFTYKILAIILDLTLQEI